MNFIKRKEDIGGKLGDTKGFGGSEGSNASWRRWFKGGDNLFRGRGVFGEERRLRGDRGEKEFWTTQKAKVKGFPSAGL